MTEGTSKPTVHKISVRTETGSQISFSVPADPDKRKEIIDRLLPVLPEGQWTESDEPLRPERRVIPRKKPQPEKKGKHGRFKGNVRNQEGGADSGA